MLNSNKKKLLFILVVLIVAYWGLRGLSTMKSANNHVNEIHGTIIRFSADDMLIEDADGGQYSVVKSDIPNQNFKIGDRVIVRYSGNIMEISPASFEKVLSVEQAKK